MAFNEIAFTIITVLLSAIGYFIKGVHGEIKAIVSEQKDIISDISHLKGKIDLVDNEARFRSDSIEKMTQLEIKHLAEQVTELTTQVRRLIEETTRRA